MKSKIILIVLFTLSVLFIVNCGGGEKKDNQQADKQEEQSSDKPANMDQYAENMQKMAEQMMGGSSDKEPVPPVSFKKLMEYLPESIGDLNREKPEGESVTWDKWSHSNARVRFTNDDYSKSAEVTVNDFAFINALYLPYKMLFSMNYQRETSDGYEKSVKVGNFPAYEKWSEQDKMSEITVLVGDRFLVEVRADGIGQGAAKNIAESMDLTSLAGEKTE